MATIITGREAGALLSIQKSRGWQFGFRVAAASRSPQLTPRLPLSTLVIAARKYENDHYLVSSTGGDSTWVDGENGEYAKKREDWRGYPGLTRAGNGNNRLPKRVISLSLAAVLSDIRVGRREINRQKDDWEGQLIGKKDGRYSWRRGEESTGEMTYRMGNFRIFRLWKFGGQIDVLVGLAHRKRK